MFSQVNNTYQVTKSSESQVMNVVTVKLRTSHRAPPVHISPQALPDDDRCDVVVAEIKDPGNFYVQLGKYPPL